MDIENRIVEFNAKKTVDSLINWIRETTTGFLKKRGAVVGISGGIDSSVVALLCVRALTPEKVIGIAMPEKDSSPDSLSLACELSKRINIELITEDITNGLEGLGSYSRRDEAVKNEVPHYNKDCKFKITLQSNPLLGKKLNLFKAVIIDKNGNETSKRLRLDNYLQIVAASNMKQRLRMTLLYYHAELRNYAVVGTGNKNEHEMGFFVKYGDGGADLQPILQLHKTQIYQIARELKVPEEIRNREPTTDTYPTEVSQEEFFYRLPFKTMDIIWEAMERGFTAEEISKELNLTSDQVRSVIEDINQKKRSTEYLRMRPLTTYSEK